MLSKALDQHAAQALQTLLKYQAAAYNRDPMKVGRGFFFSLFLLPRCRTGSFSCGSLQGQAKKRLAIGFNEVRKKLAVKKVSAIFAAPDIQESHVDRTFSNEIGKWQLSHPPNMSFSFLCLFLPGSDGPDDFLSQIFDTAKGLEVPVYFVLGCVLHPAQLEAPPSLVSNLALLSCLCSRFRMAKVLKREGQIAIVGLLDVSGVEEPLKEMRSMRLGLVDEYKAQVAKVLQKQSSTGATA